MNLFHWFGRLLPDDSDIGDLARRVFSLIVIALVAGGVIAGTVFAGAAWGEYKTRIGGAMIVSDTTQARIEYYRGVFDVCLAYSDAQQKWCEGLTRHAIEQQWFETESIGWVWANYK